MYVSMSESNGLSGTERSLSVLDRGLEVLDMFGRQSSNEVRNLMTIRTWLLRCWVADSEVVISRPN